MSTIYKNVQAQKDLMQLYNEKLQSLNIDYSEIDVNTQFGRTRIIKTGNPEGKIIVLFHGIHAGAPVTLEAVKELRNQYCFYAIDTVGQATKSAETKINIKDDSYALWADEVLEKLGIQKGNMIGISYGAFILQKLIKHRPQRVEKCIFCVPAGIVNGNFWESITQLTIPLLRFKFTKKEAHFRAFSLAYTPEEDAFMLKFQKLLLLGVNLDTRIPPLLKKKDIDHFDNPVYLMVAKKDIFFPGDKIAQRSNNLFRNLKEVYFLKDSKHMPSKNNFTEIQLTIKKWIA